MSGVRRHEHDSVRDEPRVALAIFTATVVIPFESMGQMAVDALDKIVVRKMPQYCGAEMQPSVSTQMTLSLPFDDCAAAAEPRAPPAPRMSTERLRSENIVCSASATAADAMARRDEILAFLTGDSAGFLPLMPPELLS